MNQFHQHTNTLKKLGLVAALWAGATCSHAQELSVSPAKAGGVYGVGEKIVWHVKAIGEGAQNVGKVSYVLKRGALTEMGKGELTLGADGADLETSLDAPGSILAEFQAKVPEKPVIKVAAGALVAPDQIAPSAPRPADFDAFWQAKIAELQAIPPNPILEAGESDRASADYWKISMDNIRGSKIQGQLARPKNATGKLPALLIVQWAGVYPLQKSWVTGRAAEGWLTLNINAHDLPIDNPAAFYQEKTNGELKDYRSIGNDDREQSYFLRMILSCYRAVDYLTSRDDWDGKTLVVMGSSQGGMQALMTGGLQPKVTAVIANIPAGCDHSGPLVGRRAGWPQWWDRNAEKDAEKVREASRYYDAVNFASNIKVPSLVAEGLIDTTCPIAGVRAAYNQIQAPKEFVVMENADHQGINHSQAAFYEKSNAWLKQLRMGASPIQTE